MQLTLFKEENRQAKWWRSWDWWPKVGDLVFITGMAPVLDLRTGKTTSAQWLEGWIEEMSEQDDYVILRMRDYPDCPWIDLDRVKTKFFEIECIHPSMKSWELVTTY